MKTKRPTRKKVESPFAKNLQLILEERSISQTAAAEIAGVGISSINDWLNGVQPHDLRPIIKLCEALSCDFQWLLTSTKSKTTSKNISLHELFEIEEGTSFSGIYKIEAKRLKRR